MSDTLIVSNWLPHLGSPAMHTKLCAENQPLKLVCIIALPRSSKKAELTCWLVGLSCPRTVQIFVLKCARRPQSTAIIVTLHSWGQCFHERLFTMPRLHLLVRLAATAILYPIAAARFWTVTKIYVLNPVAFPSGCDESGATNQPCTATRPGDPFLATHTTQPPDATPITTSKDTYNGWDLEVIEYYYPAGALPRSELQAYDGDYHYTYWYGHTTKWLVDLTYTAPTSCPTPLYSYTTKVNLEYLQHLPPDLSSLLSSKATLEEREVITSTRTIVTSTTAGNYVTVTETSYYTSATLHVKATDVAPAPIQKLRERYSMDYYLVQCYLPGEEDPWIKNCPHQAFGRCSKIPEGPAVILAIVGTLFVLGFIENLFWFRRLMLGQWALRCGTVCWWFIATLLMIFVSRYEVGRDPEDQEELRRQWKEMSFWLKMKLWLQWGFRLKYPERWLGPRKPVSGGERIEMGIGGGGNGGGNGSGNGSGSGGGTGGARAREQVEHDDTPLPPYPGPPSSSVSDGHSMNSGTTAATREPVLGNPNAVLGSGLGSNTVVIGSRMSPGQQQTAASPRQQ